MFDNTFSICPIEIFADPSLTKREIKVLGALFSFRNKSTNTVWPKQETIADRCGLSQPKVSEAISSLQKKGWVLAKKRGFGAKNEYQYLGSGFLLETDNEMV